MQNHYSYIDGCMQRGEGIKWRGLGGKRETQEQFGYAFLSLAIPFPISQILSRGILRSEKNEKLKRVAIG
jgi:hypothetical protein